MQSFFCCMFLWFFVCVFESFSHEEQLFGAAFSKVFGLYMCKGGIWRGERTARVASLTPSLYMSFRLRANKYLAQCLSTQQQNSHNDIKLFIQTSAEVDLFFQVKHFAAFKMFVCLKLCEHKIYKKKIIKKHKNSHISWPRAKPLNWAGKNPLRKYQKKEKQK